MSALNFPAGASMCLVATTSAKTINLPTPDTGRFVYIVDSTGGASQFPITVSTTGTGVAICNGYSTIVQPFGTLGFLANNNNWYAIVNESGINNLRTLIISNLSAAVISTNYGFFSTISTGSIYGRHIGDGSLLTGLPPSGLSIIPPVLSTTVMSSGIITGNLVSTARLSTTFGYISSLTVDSLSFGVGNGFINMGDVITTSISSIQTFTSSLLTTNLQVGIASTLSYIAFPGLQLGYNQTVIAEQSIGTGLQELLLFKGSTNTDRIRMQTTGTIVFEPGVSARVFPSASSNATPAMIITTSSNVGIGILAPTVALDVAGTGRFQILSTQQLFVSTISSGSVFGRFVGDGSLLTGLPAAGLTSLPPILSTNFLSTGFLSASNISAITMSTNFGFFSTISSGSIYSRFIGDGSLLTAIPNTGAVLAVSNLVTTNATNITTISNLLNSVSTNVTTVSTNLNTLSNNVTTISNTGATNATNITTLSNLLNSVSTNVTTVSTNLNTLSNNVTTISNTGATNTTNITTVSNTAGTNTTNITTLSNLLNSVSTNVTTVSTNLNTLSNNVTTISNTGATNATNITTISNLLNSVSTNVTTVSTNLNTLSNNVTTISSIRGSNLFIGTVSSLSYLAFPGLQQQYSQTALAEISTGTGLQEMLVFRGSSASDRIRMQTTGSIIFETGVGARVFPAAPSNVIPAMVINTSSNVGIGIAAPTVTLDVAGAGRFQTLSTQQIYASSFVGGVVSSATVYTTTISSLAGFFSTVNNYQIGGALYLPTQLFTF